MQVLTNEDVKSLIYSTWESKQTVTKKDMYIFCFIAFPFLQTFYKKDEYLLERYSSFLYLSAPVNH